MKKENEYMEGFGQRVRYYRELIGMSRDELAVKLGYKDKSSIGKIENGAACVPAHKVLSFAKALDCEVSDLVTPLQPIDQDFITEVIQKNTTSGSSAEKLQHIMLILSQMSADQIAKAESILSTIFEE